MSRAGSLYYERIDAQTYADWKVDYLKYDNCGQVGCFYGNNSLHVAPQVTLQSYAKFMAMRDALNATGRCAELRRIDVLI